MKARTRLLGIATLAVSLAIAGSAWGVDVPLGNWDVPPSVMSDLDNPSAFVPVTPCRVVDTRGAAGAYGGPALVANATRAFDIDSGPCTGIPAGATAYSLNFTVIASAGAYQNAFLTAWNTGAAMPTVSTLNFDAGQLRANAAIVPRGTSGQISVFVNAATHLIIDINGYFTGNPNTGNQFFISGNFDAAAAIVGFNYSNANFSHGVGGYANGTGLVHGVQGEIGTSPAVGSSGVHGIGANTTRRTYAVLGENYSGVSNAAAVMGIQGALSASTVLFAAAGVRGESATGNGVIGVSQASGTVAVRGDNVDGAGATETYGILGGSSGVVYGGGLSGTGTKNFVEPHPTDATKEIRYVSLEGPEAGTYFRGTGFTQGGVFVIEVPETFRMVTAEEGLTVQVTSVGSPARTWVESESLDQIVIRSSADTKFHYLVQGVRRAYRDYPVVFENTLFVPDSPNATLPAYLSEDEKQRLVANGTYNPDGTVNMQMAERMGWARQWRERDKVQK